ncbi:MAG: 3-methyl-2-oxobutanoate hydroxymethyltransferase, partial [Candidatus Hermodarchaeia archaeon]
ASNDHLPKFVKQYSSLNTIIGEAVTEFMEEVREGKYPAKKHTYH